MAKIVNPIRIDIATSTITVMTKPFWKAANCYGTTEYNQLQAVRRDYPSFNVVCRQINANSSQEHYSGLTYDFMRDYIRDHEGENAVEILNALEEMIGISKCHSKSKRYPEIKHWFLDRYPNVATFGMNEDEVKRYATKRAERAKADKKKAAASVAANVTSLPTTEDEGEAA